MRYSRLGRSAVVAATGILAVTAAMFATPAFAGTPTADDKAPAAKLTSTLESTFEKSGSTDFWLRFSDKANLGPASSIKDWTERGQYVVDALEKTAKASQAGAVAELEAAKVNYKTYAISNAILVKDASENLALKLAADPEIKTVHERAKVSLVEPVKKEASTKAPQGIEWGIDFVNAPEAWEQGATGAGIVVSSVDSGTDYTHPALVDQYRGNNGDGSFTHDYNWYDAYDDCSNGPCDLDGHGTHTMGTMVGDDGAGNQIGVAPDAEWIETNGCCGSDAGLLESGWWLLEPTDAAGQNPDVSKRPHVINNSWGWDGVGHIDSFFDDVNAAWNAAGQFSSWASGNPGSMCQGTSSPGANVLTYAVGAVDSSGNVASFSGRGPGQNGLVKPNIAAPGVSVRSSLPGGSYGSYNGTSMAAPHVAGAVAALWSYNPTLVGDVEETRRLLNEAATDVDDTTCGGTAENNNVYGEGHLDLARLIALAPAEGGTIAGTVTSGGEAIEGATVELDGEALDRTLTTDAEGHFSADVYVGDYELTASAFGFVTESSTAKVVEGATATVDFDLAGAPKYTVSGAVTNASTGAPVAGAEIQLSPGNLSATSGANGAYTLAGVPEGTYTIFTEGSGCAAPTSAEVVVTGNKTHNVKLVFSYDDHGYFCAEGSSGVRSGTTALGLEGDDVSGAVDLPFSFPLYGGSYAKAYVSSNGHVNFLAANTSYSNVAIPAAGVPNAALYAFWDDLDTRGAADVFTGATTVDGVDAFVIEWRDVYPRGATDQVMDFSATLFEDGRVELGYGDLPNVDRTLGSSATIGIENANGSIATQYSFNTASLSDSKSITFDMAPRGTVAGVVKDYNTKSGIDGAEVTLTPAGGGNAKTVTTGADGSYSVDTVTGKYAVSFTAPDYQPINRNITVTEDTTLTSNAQLKAGRLAVTQTSLDASLAMGGSVSRNLRITNSGSAPAEVNLGAAGEEVVIQGEKSTSAGVTKSVTKEATKVKTKSDAGSKASGLASSKSGSKLGSTGQPSVTALAPTPAGETTLSHSTSHEVAQASSVACPSGTTTILRTYSPGDFGVSGSFTPTSVSFAVQESANGNTPVTATLYTLPEGAAFTFANLTPIGSGTTTVTDEFGSLYTVSIATSTEIAPDDILVVGVAGGAVYFGGNPAAETSPTYLASDACGTPEPTDAAGLGFPDSNIILDVTGEAGGAGGGPAWLDIQPPTFTLAPGQSVVAVASFTAAVDQPGTYTADVVIGNNTPYTVAPVPATMTVKAPAGWGKITGTVSGSGEPIEDAVVALDGVSYDVTLRTDSDGRYAYWMQKSNAPLQVVVAADGFVPATKKAQIVAGQTTVYDFDLKPLD
ncbi:carboxypeptidase regulatory-like domain-containing protein [Nocardioides panzhihuensis]|uniref:Subtilisin family serine protease n=1 Tax=Nocardioides panzhihuensis TaxID=860243 RepID=A0A7Z0IV97_9ACTN|nr:carboxypeptidase regulatory-like domain-containing protein [Nocardioides panzhihuensis]NYI81064.1 subtilisin family serine protease [Nocardioides panzhihuensis]